jgi:lysozyme family protein
VYDALVNCPSKAAKNTDWSVGGTLTLLEQYNGLGYANNRVPSPCTWSGTDQYKAGRYRPCRRTRAMSRWASRTS